MTATISKGQDRPRIDQQRVDGAVIVSPTGGLDAELVADIRQVVLEAHAPVVIDLTGSVLIDPAAVQRIASGWELYRPRMAITCRRPAGRQLLDRAGLSDHVAIFEHIEDAFDALASCTEDFDGWAPTGHLSGRAAFDAGAESSRVTDVSRRVTPAVG